MINEEGVLRFTCSERTKRAFSVSRGEASRAKNGLPLFDANLFFAGVDKHGVGLVRHACTCDN